MSRTMRVIAVYLTLAAGAFAQREVKPGFNLFSKEQDVQLGREAAAQVEQQMPVVRDAQLQSYVESIGRRLAATPEADRYPYTFKVVNDKAINAFALPGGPTYVNTGLIAAAENEGQLAGVMAHEIAHVALRHGTNQASKANLLQLPAMLAGAVVGNSGSMLGQLAQLGIGLGFNSVLMKYSRNAERDADILGARMMARAGYNPIEMARFFEKLAAQGGSGGPAFFSSHPDPGNRMKTIQEEIRHIPQRNFNADSGGLRQIQSRIGGLPAAAAPRGVRQQADTGDPRPSGQMRQYQGRAFSMSYPSNWETFGDAEGAMLTIAPRSGLAQDGQGGTAVAYGAMVSFYFPHQRGRRDNLRDDTSDLIGQLQQSNPALQSGGRQSSARVDGQQALVTTLYNQSPIRGEREVDLLVTVQRPEGLFYMIFIAPERDFSQIQGVFENMLRSVRFR